MVAIPQQWITDMFHTAWPLVVAQIEEGLWPRQIQNVTGVTTLMMMELGEPEQQRRNSPLRDNFAHQQKCHSLVSTYQSQ